MRSSCGERGTIKPPNWCTKPRSRCLPILRNSGTTTAFSSATGGKLGEALDAVEHGVRLQPNYAKAFATKGKILELLHRFPEARTCYQTALDLDPRDAASSNNIAVCLLGEGKSAEAETWFEKTLQVDPNWTDALFNLAALKLDRDEFGRARPFVEQLVQLLPNDPEVASLQARMRDSGRERLTLQMPGARSLESGLTPAVKRLCEQLAGNPRSIFISYAWPDPATKAFAARMACDLEANSFQIVLDQKHDLEVHEILVILLHCQNVVVLNDPITGQGSNNAAKCAASYLASITGRGEGPFDAAWMTDTFETYWEYAKDVTSWTNALLGPPPPFVLELLGAACGNQRIANRFVNGFDDPRDYQKWFLNPDLAAAYLAEVAD